MTTPAPVIPISQTEGAPILLMFHSTVARHVGGIPGGKSAENDLFATTRSTNRLRAILFPHSRVTLHQMTLAIQNERYGTRSCANWSSSGCDSAANVVSLLHHCSFNCFVEICCQWFAKLVCSSSTGKTRCCHLAAAVGVLIDFGLPGSLRWH